MFQFAVLQGIKINMIFLNYNVFTENIHTKVIDHSDHF